METQDTQTQAETKATPQKGLSAFRRQKPPEPDKVNAEVVESVAYFKSFMKTSEGGEAAGEAAAPAMDEAETVHTTPAATAPLVTHAPAQEVARQAPAPALHADETKPATSKSAREFPADATAYSWRWEKRLQADWEDKQLRWKKEGTRVSVRELIVVGICEVLKLTREEFEARRSAALEKYGNK